MALIFTPQCRESSMNHRLIHPKTPGMVNRFRWRTWPAYSKLAGIVIQAPTSSPTTANENRKKLVIIVAK